VNSRYIFLKLEHMSTTFTFKRDIRNRNMENLFAISEPSGMVVVLHNANNMVNTFFSVIIIFKADVQMFYRPTVH